MSGVRVLRSQSALVVWLLLGLASHSGLAGSTSAPQRADTATCPPQSQSHPIALSLRQALAAAGTWDLVMIRDSGTTRDSVIRGRMQLNVVRRVYRTRYTSPGVLWVFSGSAELDTAALAPIDFFVLSRLPPGHLDIDGDFQVSPGYLGLSVGTGYEPGTMSLDVGVELEVWLSDSLDLGGRWRDTGMSGSNAVGHFCARRVTRHR